MTNGGDLALVLGGGGARAAFQVGFLRGLARICPTLEIPILTGVSAGAISAAFLANHRGPFGQAAEDLARVWSDLTVERVFRADSGSLASHVFIWGLRLISGGARMRPPTRGMVDTSPLREYLHHALATSDGTLPGVEERLATGRLKALAITTTKYTTQQSITWVQGGEGIEWLRPYRKSLHGKITVEHVMASSALPLFFPAIQLGEDWHGDGGIRLTAPLAPALHLGAGRLLAISTRYERSQRDAEEPGDRGYPAPATVIGTLLSAVFLDMLDYDAMNLQRINDLLRGLPEDRRAGLRVANLLMVRPSQNVGKLATRYEPTLPKTFRFLTRGLGTRETKTPEALSMVLFQPEYIRTLMQLGEQDAERRADELRAFVAGEERPSIAQTGFWRI